MITPKNALRSVPRSLREPLLKEYRAINDNFMENRWTPTELSGGRFCEIVYSILKGYSSGTYPAKATKPRNFVEACRRLENNSGVPRSFQILIPRLLPGLYEIRNNRGVGHVGGDVDSNLMDSAIVVYMASWILAELVRVFHNVTTSEAQRLVDNLVERRMPLVWKCGDIRRVLKPGILLKDQIMILLGSCAKQVKYDELLEWTESVNRRYFKKTVRILHKERLLEYDEKSSIIQLLPPGAEYLSNFLKDG